MSETNASSNLVPKVYLSQALDFDSGLVKSFPLSDLDPALTESTLPFSDKSSIPINSVDTPMSPSILSLALWSPPSASNSKYHDTLPQLYSRKGQGLNDHQSNLLTCDSNESGLSSTGSVAAAAIGDENSMDTELPSFKNVLIAGPDSSFVKLSKGKVDPSQLPPSRRPGVSHARKTPVDHIKRPRNAYIIFRSYSVSQGLIPKEVESDHRNITRIISHMWKSLDAQERAPWEEMAKQEKEAHRQKYPDYKYQPTGKRENVARRNVKRLENAEEQCQEIADIILKAHGREGVVPKEQQLPSPAKRKRTETAKQRSSNRCSNKKLRSSSSSQLFDSSGKSIPTRSVRRTNKKARGYKHETHQQPQISLPAVFLHRQDSSPTTIPALGPSTLNDGIAHSMTTSSSSSSPSNCESISLSLDHQDVYSPPTSTLFLDRRASSAPPISPLYLPPGVQAKERMENEMDVDHLQHHHHHQQLQENHVKMDPAPTKRPSITSTDPEVLAWNTRIEEFDRQQQHQHQQQQHQHHPFGILNEAPGDQLAISTFSTHRQRCRIPPPLNGWQFNLCDDQALPSLASNGFQANIVAPIFPRLGNQRPHTAEASTPLSASFRIAFQPWVSGHDFTLVSPMRCTFQEYRRMSAAWYNQNGRLPLLPNHLDSGSASRLEFRMDATDVDKLAIEERSKQVTSSAETTTTTTATDSITEPVIPDSDGPHSVVLFSDADHSVPASASGCLDSANRLLSSSIDQHGQQQDLHSFHGGDLNQPKNDNDASSSSSSSLDVTAATVVVSPESMNSPQMHQPLTARGSDDKVFQFSVSENEKQQQELGEKLSRWSTAGQLSKSTLAEAASDWVNSLSRDSNKSSNGCGGSGSGDSAYQTKRVEIGKPDTMSSSLEPTTSYTSPSHSVREQRRSTLDNIRTTIEQAVEGVLERHQARCTLDGYDNKPVMIPSQFPSKAAILQQLEHRFSYDLRISRAISSSIQTHSKQDEIDSDRYTRLSTSYGNEMTQQTVRQDDGFEHHHQQQHPHPHTFDRLPIRHSPHRCHPPQFLPLTHSNTAHPAFSESMLCHVVETPKPLLSSSRSQSSHVSLPIEEACFIDTGMTEIDSQSIHSSSIGGLSSPAETVRSISSCHNPPPYPPTNSMSLQGYRTMDHFGLDRSSYRY